MGIFEHISEWIYEKFGEILDYIGRIFDTAFTDMTAFVDGLTSTLTSAFSTAVNFLEDTVNSMSLLIQGMYDWMTDQAKGFTDFVTETFNAVSAELTNIYNSITSWLNDLYNQMTDWLTTIGQEIKGYFDMGYELLKSFFTDQWKQIEDFMSLIKDSIVVGFDDTLNWVIDKVQESFDTVRAAFLDLQDWMLELWNSFKLSITFIVESFEASISDLVDILIGFIQDLWDDIKAYINSLTDYTQAELESFVESAMTAQMNIMKKLALQV